MKIKCMLSEYLMCTVAYSALAVIFLSHSVLYNFCTWNSIIK